MKKSIFKAISAMLSLAIVTGLLCSCGNKKPGSNSSELMSEEVVDYQEVVDSQSNSAISGDVSGKANTSGQTTGSGNTSGSQS